MLDLQNSPESGLLGGNKLISIFKPKVVRILCALLVEYKNATRCGMLLFLPQPDSCHTQTLARVSLGGSPKRKRFEKPETSTATHSAKCWLRVPKII